MYDSIKFNAPSYQAVPILGAIAAQAMPRLGAIAAQAVPILGAIAAQTVPTLGAPSIQNVPTLGRGPMLVGNRPTLVGDTVGEIKITAAWPVAVFAVLGAAVGAHKQATIGYGATVGAAAGATAGAALGHLLSQVFAAKLAVTK